MDGSPKFNLKRIMFIGKNLEESYLMNFTNQAKKLTRPDEIILSLIFIIKMIGSKMY